MVFEAQELLARVWYAPHLRRAKRDRPLAFKAIVRSELATSIAAGETAPVHPLDPFSPPQRTYGHRGRSHFYSERPHREYIQHALASGVTIYLSGLVVAEFSRRQDISDLGLNNFVPAPFNVPDGILAGSFAEMAKRDDGDNRASVLVDVMLIAQAHRLKLPAILTDDAGTLAKYLERLNSQKATEVKAILTTEGFDPNLLVDPSAPGLALRVVK